MSVSQHRNLQHVIDINQRFSYFWRINIWTMVSISTHHWIYQLILVYQHVININWELLNLYTFLLLPSPKKRFRLRNFLARTIGQVGNFWGRYFYRQNLNRLRVASWSIYTGHGAWPCRHSAVVGCELTDLGFLMSPGKKHVKLSKTRDPMAFDCLVNKCYILGFNRDSHHEH